MKLNRRRGATLGLVAVCVLVIIVLGVGFFILSQILGGGREVANATDAGVLNVARRALSPTLIQVPLGGDSAGTPTDDFLAYGVNTGGNPNTGTGALDSTHRNISMLALNRIVAQSVIVACNAQEINTTAASGHAHNVAAAAKAVATQLRTLIQGSTLNNEFTTVAHSNNTKMFQGNKVTLTGLTSNFLRPGLSTNVYVTPALQGAINVSLPSNLKSNFHHPNALKHDLAGQDQYMAGYINFSVPAGPNGPIDIAGVPIFPKQKPHLVDIGEFTSGTSPAAYLPPNAFRANSQTLENNSSGFGGAVACALVGALDQDFAASIPRGYVRIKNGPDAGAAHSGIVSNPVVDGQNDIFNNELWPPNGGGVDVGNNGVYALNSNSAGQNQMASWRAYNQNPSGIDPTTNLPFAGPPPFDQVSIITGTGVGWRAATQTDMEGLNDIADDCDAVDGWDRRAECKFPADSGAVPGDGSIVTALQNQEGAGSTQTAPTNTGGYTAVEVQKHDLLSKRYGGGRCASVIPIGTGAQKYGMKKFEPNGCYATPSSNVAFGAPGSPYQYIEQIANGTHSGSPAAGAPGCKNDILNRIWSRIKQVDPQITLPQVETALRSQSLELGETLYLHCPGPGAVAMVSGTPADYFNSGIPNDGASSAAIYNCENTYNISNTIINANKGSGNGAAGTTCGGHGDANFHQAPFQDGPGFLPGVDRAVWTPSSGWRNLLGDIEFQNEAGGAGTFCKPN